MEMACSFICSRSMEKILSCGHVKSATSAWSRRRSALVHQAVGAGMMSCML
jgi:hypothetical protein